MIKHIWNDAEDLIPEISAKSDIITGYCALEVNVAKSLLKCLKPSIWDHVKTSKGLWKSWVGIEFPIGDTISDHKTLNRYLCHIGP